MASTGSTEVTRLLRESVSRDGTCDRLLTLVYDQLRKLAQQRLAQERVGHTLQATALVHEAYLRLVGDEGLQWQSRAHFFAAAAQAMRRILVEHARARGRIKRGGDGAGRAAARSPINLLDLAAECNSDEILMLDEAIRRLESEDPEAAQVVRFRFFAGLSVDETAEVLGVSPSTVDREWAFARAWLHRTLREM